MYLIDVSGNDMVTKLWFLLYQLIVDINLRIYIPLTRIENHDCATSAMKKTANPDPTRTHDIQK